MNGIKKLVNWNVFDLCHGVSSSYAIIILNNAIKEHEDNKYILNLWKRASFRLCVDGAINQFHKCFQRNYTKNLKTKDESKKTLNGSSLFENGSFAVKDIPLPDVISGDFDSADPSILDYFEKLGVCVISTPDQNKTDFTKSIYILDDLVFKNDIPIDHIIVIGGISNSRFDHTIAHIRTLNKMKSDISFPIIMICGESLFWFLEPGSNRILIPRDVLGVKESSWCGYAAFGESVTVRTRGLKWDVENELVGFDHLISTSNTYSPSCDGTVLVDCSGPLLWFMGWLPNRTHDKTQISIKEPPTLVIK